VPINDVIQPDIINIEENLRIRKPYTGEWGVAVPWYHNPEVMYFSEGVTNKVYEIENINCMYTILSNQGELYYIEVLEDNIWRSIGDVGLSEKNLPIVIGDENYWGRGIGGKVVNVLIDRAKKLGLEKISIQIFKYNTRSKNLFTSVGFFKVSEDEDSDYFELRLKQ
jgi:RimJ/RimL family protein N-acetyltransferase